jgi:cysteine desulfurase
MPIYFDHAATTPLCEEAFAAMQPYLRGNYGNPSSLHHMGKAAQFALEVARAQVAALLNARPAEILLNSGATEGSNHALKGAAWHRRERGRHIIVSKIEHDAVMYPCEALEKEGFEITYVDVESDGIIDPERIKNTFRDDTILVSVMHANNEMGTLQPIREIGAMCRERQILFHCDAVQTVGHIPVDVREMNVDLLTLSAHKFYGPKGAGALFIRRGVRINTLIDGGHQQKGRRGGTENVPGIVGMGAAAEVAARAIANGEENAVAVLRDQLIEGIEVNVEGAFLNGHRTNRVPGVVNFSFDGIEGEGLILEMDAKAGVCLSTGSACAAGSLDPSPVLLAIGRPNGLARAGTRFSLGRDNTKEEVDSVVQLLPEVLSSLRGLLPQG